MEFDRGCIPMTVNITELDTFGDIIRQYNYEENSNISSSKTYTYTKAGVYEIIQSISGVPQGVSRRDTLKVEVVDSSKPEVRIEKCNGNAFFFFNEETNYDFIRVYFEGTDSLQLNQGESGAYSFSSSNVQTIIFKGFYQNADEICSEFFEEILPIQALSPPQISSLSIKETCKDVFKMFLELASIDTLITYQVLLSQNNTTVLFEGNLKENQLTFSDISFMPLETNYCVQVNAIDPCNSSRIDGSEICKESSSLSLSPFESLYSSYESTGILINLGDISSGSFNVFRRSEREEFQLEDSVTSSYIDFIGSNSRKYYYKIDYVDSCNQILYSSETNPPFVEARNLDQNTYLVNYFPPKNNLESAIETKYIVGNEETYSSIPISTPSSEINLNPKDGTSIQFLTSQVLYDNDIAIKSNPQTLKYKIIIHVPSAFTPNNDGLNDTLELFGLPSNTATTNIYTKWGQLIYSSNEPTPGWDGTINGKTAPEGTYLYEIIFESTDGGKLMQKGTFALIKK